MINLRMDSRSVDVVISELLGAFTIRRVGSIVDSAVVTQVKSSYTKKWEQYEVGKVGRAFAKGLAEEGKPPDLGIGSLWQQLKKTAGIVAQDTGQTEMGHFTGSTYQSISAMRRYSSNTAAISQVAPWGIWPNRSVGRTWDNLNWGASGVDPTGLGGVDPLRGSPDDPAILYEIDRAQGDKGFIDFLRRGDASSNKGRVSQGGTSSSVRRVLEAPESGYIKVTAAGAIIQYPEIGNLGQHKPIRIAARPMISIKYGGKSHPVDFMTLTPQEKQKVRRSVNRTLGALFHQVMRA